MLCYECAKSGREQQAVALRRSCAAEHLRDAAQIASANPLASCRHDTWAGVDARTPATGLGFCRAASRDRGRRVRDRDAGTLRSS